MSVNHIFYFIIGTGYFLLSPVDGQCTNETRPYQFSASYLPQYLTSPNYPNDYPVNQSCAWLVNAPSPDDRIIFNIEDVAAEGTTLPCKYDFVAVYDGENNSSAELARLCNGNKNTVNTLVSTTDSLYVVFVSDHAFNFKGFRILIFTNNSNYLPNCNSSVALRATSDTKFLMSPNLPNPYLSNYTCTVKIVPDTLYYAVQFNMYFMDIETSTDCTKDSFQLISVTDSTTTEEATECSRSTTYEFDNFPRNISGDYILLNFTTDSDNNFYGFLLTYEQVPRGINLTRPANGSTTKLTFREDQPTGHLNKSVAVIELTYTGELELQIWPSYERTSNKTVSLRNDVQIFAFTDEKPYIYLDLISSLDYEVIKKFSLVVTIVDTDVSQLTFSLTFNITITDIDDLAPTFLNLPSNITIMRNQKAGVLLYTVNATDYDASQQFRKIVFQIFDGDTDSMFSINATSGDVKLKKNANHIPLSTMEYNLIIAAYSGTSTASALAEFSTLTVSIFPDSPPECSHTHVWAQIIDLNLAGPGDEIQFLENWSCADDNNNITYSIESVSPNLTLPLFHIDNLTGGIKLIRRFAATEIPSRQFVIEIGATDTVEQMVTIKLSMNVTALTCLPNPRKLYVRMDHELNGVLLNDFNCTLSSGLSFFLSQYPEGTFDVDYSLNGTGRLILKKPVFKVKFYGLTLTITDGIDVAELKFQVIIQTPRCGIPTSSAKSTKNIAHAALVVGFILLYQVLSR